jgi:hypothetical protein
MKQRGEAFEFEEVVHRGSWQCPVPGLEIAWTEWYAGAPRAPKFATLCDENLAL